MAILSLQEAITALSNCIAVEIGNHISYVSPEDGAESLQFLEVNIGDPEHPDRTYTFSRDRNQLVKTDGHSMWLHAENADERLELKLLGYMDAGGKRQFAEALKPAVTAPMVESGERFRSQVLPEDVDYQLGSPAYIPHDDDKVLARVNPVDALTRIRDLIGGEAEDPDRAIAQMQDIAAEALRSLVPIDTGTTDEMCRMSQEGLGLLLYSRAVAQGRMLTEVEQLLLSGALPQRDFTLHCGRAMGKTEAWSPVVVASRTVGKSWTGSRVESSNLPQSTVTKLIDAVRDQRDWDCTESLRPGQSDERVAHLRNRVVRLSELIGEVKVYNDLTPWYEELTGPINHGENRAPHRLQVGVDDLNTF